MTGPSPKIIVGVDTHTDIHVCCAIDRAGRQLGSLQIPTTPAGYRSLLVWANKLGDLDAVGIEGTGAYGAGLARFLVSVGVLVIEVDRPNRQHRRRHGKSDQADAHSAACAVLSGEANGTAKHMSGQINAVRELHVVRRSAVAARTQAGNQIKDLVVTADDKTRAQLRDLSTPQRVRLAATWRPGPNDHTRTAIKELAQRWLFVHEQVERIEARIKPLLEKLCPTLLAEHGVGLNVAAKLVIAVGENPERLRNEASFAAHCGTSPIDASSGKQQRHRLNRGGNRQANNALHTVWLVRARTHQETRDYITKRTQQGKTRRETSRCIKRALARRFHHILQHDLQHLT